jgi:DNA-binding NarL/FixJ family response regulator
MSDVDEPTDDRVRVMVVDDHAVVRNGLEQLIATTSDLVLVGAAANGAEALDLAEAVEPHVILMDLSMPIMDGVEATRRLHVSHPDAKVLVLTSFSEQRRIVEAMNAGAEGYLLKHADPDQILAGIRAVFEGGLPLDPMVARALLTARQPAALVELTSREREVLDLVRQGLANKAIARRLGISERTVKAHLGSVFQRLGVTDRTQAALWAKDNLH